MKAGVGISIPTNWKIPKKIVLIIIEERTQVEIL